MHITKNNLRIGRPWFISIVLSVAVMYFALSMTSFASLDLFMVAIVIGSGAVYLRLNDILNNLLVSLAISLSLPLLTFGVIALLTLCDYVYDPEALVCGFINLFDYNALVYGYLSILAVILVYLTVKEGRPR